MLCADVIDHAYPVLQLHESTVGEALALYEEKNILSFPVLDNDELAGILWVKDILHLSGKTGIITVQHRFTMASVLESVYFYAAFKVMEITGTIVPVTDAQHKYCGAISQASLLQALGVFLDIQQSNGGIIILEMGKVDYSFSEIARLVESCEANIIQLNTYFDVKADVFMVNLRVNRNDISEIISTLQRHDYHVAYYFGEERYENEIKRNYDALMNYLNI